MGKKKQNQKQSRRPREKRKRSRRPALSRSQEALTLKLGPRQLAEVAAGLRHEARQLELEARRQLGHELTTHNFSESQVSDLRNRGIVVEGIEHKPPFKQRNQHSKIDFKSFIVSKFVGHFCSGAVPIIDACGASALSILTGDNPNDISKKNRAGWTSRFMVKYLRSRGFDCIRLNMTNITNLDSIDNPIGAYHVILASIQLIKGISSWVVIHNRIQYHNYDASRSSLYEVINHPIKESFLLYHPSWK